MSRSPRSRAPARFAVETLYEEDFVIAMRAGHPFTGDGTLDGFCAEQHLVVSQNGDTHGFVDEVLAGLGRSRRVAATVPNFMMALATLAETDFLSALPRRFVALHAARFGIIAIDPPLGLQRFPICSIVPNAALMDAGTAWLIATLQQIGGSIGPPSGQAGQARISHRKRDIFLSGG